MKASDLIIQLKGLIDQFGDLEVRTGSGLQNRAPAPWYSVSDGGHPEPRGWKEGHGFFLD